MPRKIELKWFRLWAPEVLGNADPDGFNAYKEFGPEEHWCWVALRALCASTEMQPVICVTPFHGYKDQQFADLFKVDIRVWIVVKKKLEIAGKIEVDSENVIRIVGWERFGGRYFEGRQNRDKEMKLWSEEDDKKEREKKKHKAEIFKRVIAYLNEQSGRNFKVGAPDSFKHFSARFDEGATEEQFRHVIEVTCAQWRGRPDMECYLRPQTLFNSAKFWGYEGQPPVRKARAMPGTADLSILPEEITKYEAEAKVEYDKRLKAAKEKYGWTKDEEIDWFKVPLFAEFFRVFIKKKRESGSWSLT